MSAEPRNEPLIESGYLYAGITILIWASFIIISRIAGKGVLTPYDITALRIGTAGLVLAPWWLPRLLNPARRKIELKKTLFLAVIVGMIYPLLAYSAFNFAPGAHAAVLISGLLPMFVTVIAVFLLRERPNRVRVLGLSLIAAGVFTLIAGSLRTSVAGPHGPVWIGDLMFITASLLWALFTVLLKRWQVRAFDVTLGVVALSVLIYFPIYLTVLPSNMAQAPMRDIVTQAFFQGFVMVCCAMIIYAKAQESLGPARLAVLMSSVPAVGALLSVAILNEPLGQSAAIGVALTSVGALIGALAHAPTAVSVPAR